MKKKWKDKNHNEKKWFLIRLIGGISFLVAGAIFGLVSLYMNGWSFTKFITDPTTDLILLCLLAFGIITISSLEIK